MKSKIASNLKKCATCKFYITHKKLVMFGKVVEVESRAPCIKTYNGNSVHYTAICKNYVRDPYL